MDDNQKVEIIVADKDQRTWAMFCHLSALAGLLFPFGSVIGPLIVWLVKKKKCHLLLSMVANH